ncbi:S8 family peptidase [Microcystis viridis]|uniref:S8 family peptidase n=2 Tax=Microcystis TaxID=1125 RepID=A0ABR8GAH8_MICVR|nr:S8 family peptidase [Microcystis viridis]MBD2600164.1 S8 family peptidase [Microcystis viridis FACHB-1342]
MNPDFPLLSLTQPQTAKRGKEPPRLLPLSPEKIQQRKEKADNLRQQVRRISRQLQEMSEEERKSVLIKLEHEQKINLSGTGLKPIAESTQHFTLAVPRTEKLDKLEEKIEEFGEGDLKRGQPPNKDFAYLNTIEEASPQDRLCQVFFEQYDELIQKDWIIFEIEMMSLERGEKQQRQELLKIREEISKLFESGTKGNLFEQEEIKGTCRAVIRCTGEVFQELVEDRKWQTKIVYFDARPAFETFHQTLRNFSVEKLGEFISPPSDAPMVCIVDSGVTIENPFLKPVVREDLILSFLRTESDKDNPNDECGHGSGVASLASYYALNLYQNAENRGKIWIASARVLNQDNEIEDERLFSKILEEVVKTFTLIGIKIFNLSIQFINRKWHEEAKRTIPRRSWIARTIDKLSREHNIVFITVTGNISTSNVKYYYGDGLAYPEYFIDDEASIYDPGQASLAITVGSMSPTTQAVGQITTAMAIAEKHQPSPFTRCGPGINREIKPELVEYGGNYLLDQNGTVRENPGMNVIMASHQLTPAITHKSGTSFAAPRVAHKMARILYDMQSLGFDDISASLLKALTVNSATYPPYYGNFDNFKQAMDEKKPKHWLNVVGYGIPDDIRATECDKYTAILIFQEKIQPNTVKFFEIPVPECLVETPPTKVKRLTVTVVYAPEVQRWGLETYLGTTLKWRMFRGNVDQEEVIKYMSVEEEENDEETGENPKELKFEPGITLRSRGTVQHGICEWKQHKSEYSQNCYTLAIAAYEKWNRENPDPVPYAVVVRLEDTTQTADVYVEVQNIMAQLEVQARSNI